MRHRPIPASAAGPFRGFVLVLAGVLALVRGFTLHNAHLALLAYGLGTAALMLGFWHLARRSGGPRG